MKKIASITPFMFSEKGHHYSYFSSFHKAAQSLNIFTKTYVPKDCSIKNLDDNWVLFFKNHKNKWIRSFFHLIDYFKFALNHRKDNVILFYESFSIPNYFAIVLSLYFLSNKNQKAWVFFRDTIPTNTLQRWLQTIFSKLLIIRLQSRFIPLTDSELIAKVIEKRIKTKVHVVPIPHTEDFNTTKETNLTYHRLWLPGIAAVSKGLKNIKKVVRSNDPNGASLQLLINEEAKYYFDDITSPIVNVRYLPKVLSKNDYNTIMGSIDFVILPYDPVIYQNRTSGIFIEAIVAGKIPLIKDGSWMAYELLKFDLNELIINWDNTNLPTKIIDLKKIKP